MNLPLAPLDYYFARPNLFAIQFVFRYGYDLDELRLGKALREVADSFVPLRMVLERTGSRLQLVPGSLPQVESVDGTQPILGLRTSLGEPMFRIGIGDKVLSVAMSHGLGDGHSFFTVLHALTQAYQGRTFLLPQLDRSVLEPKSLRDPFSLSQLPERTSYFLGEIRHDSHRSIEHFVLESGRDAGGTESDRAMAQLFQKFAAHSEHDGEYLLRFPVDFRRLLPELSPRYFGNAVRDALVRLPRNPNEYSLGDLVARIAQAKASIDTASVRDALSCYAQLRDREGIDAFQRLCYPGLLVSNLMRLPLEQLDFGGGKPESLQTGEGTPRLAILQAKGPGQISVTYYLP